MEHGPYGIGEYPNHSFCCTIRCRAVWDCGVWLDAVALEVPISSPYIDRHPPTQTQQHRAPQCWDIFTQPCHTLQDPSTLSILLKRSVMTMTAALLLAEKQSMTVFWLQRIVHTTVRIPARQASTTMGAAMAHNICAHHGCQFTHTDKGTHSVYGTHGGPCAGAGGCIIVHIVDALAVHCA